MRRILLGLGLLSASANAVLAAGYAVREQSAEAMGTAYAGAAATATDASYLAYNPAAASTAGGPGGPRAGEGDFAFGAVSIMPNSSATYGAALTAAGTQTGGSKTPNNFIRNAIIPDFAMRERLSDRWSAALSVSVPWGLSTGYGASALRYYGEDTKLLTANITPVLAYDLLPNLTLAAGFQAQYAKGTLTSAIDLGTLGLLSGIPGSVPGAIDGAARLNAHSWGYGFVLGGRAILDDGWTLGLSYRSRVHHSLTGPLTYTLDSAGLGAAIRGATGLFSNTNGRAALTTPDVAEFGARKQWDDRWSGLLEVDWTGWSAFQELRVIAANPVQPNDVTNAQWHDAWMAALGVEYIADDRWTLRAGTAYDGSPVPDATLSPRIPDADRYWLAAGVTYHASAATDLKFTAGHLFNDSRTISQTAAMTGNALRGTLLGTTNSSVNVVGLTLAYRWSAG